MMIVYLYIGILIGGCAGYILSMGISGYKLYIAKRNGYREGIAKANFQALKAVHDLKIKCTEPRLEDTIEGFKTTFYVDVFTDIN